MYNHIKRDALIQFIEGDKQPDEERKNNLITKEEITNLESHNIHLNVSISSGCENGIYVNNKDSAHWLDRQLRSHIEFSLVDEKLCLLFYHIRPGILHRKCRKRSFRLSQQIIKLLYNFTL